MSYTIKSLRMETGLTQNAFAKRFGIPLKTLQHWEAGDSKPAPYIISLIASNLPFNKERCRCIEYKNERYYYDEIRKMFYDQEGNSFAYNLPENANELNLGLYLHDYFKENKELMRFFDSSLNAPDNDIKWEEFI